MTYTEELVREFVDSKIAPFFAKSSYGLATITNTVTPKLYRMPHPTTAYNPTMFYEFMTDANAAAAVDYDLSNFDTIVYLYTPKVDMPVQAGNTVVATYTLDWYLFVHELGHTFGLAHANLWQVADGNPISSAGYSNEYRDNYDPMGGGLEGSDYNPWYKYMLGWITESQVKTITSTGIYRVYNFDSAEAKGILALKVVKDAEKDYWISCRRNIDTNSGVYENPTIESGAYILWGYHDGRCGDGFALLGCSDLLDMNTPGTSVDDAALALGQRFYDPEASIAFTVLSNGGEAPSAYMDVYVEIGASPSPSRTLNLSTRASVQTADDVMIGGFIVDGANPKKLLIRAIGPSLRQSNIVGFLADPILELHDAEQVLVTSDDWRSGGQETEIEESGIAPVDDRESAIIVTLKPGSFTTIIRGKEDTSGLGLVEVFDLDQEPGSALANISTRAHVQTGDGAVIGGFILGGSTAAGQVVVRGLGPSLPVENRLADPILELYDANGAKIGENDNWKFDATSGLSQEARIMATGLAPAEDLECAIATTLAPGAYTAVMRGNALATGVGLVEIYRLP